MAKQPVPIQFPIGGIAEVQPYAAPPANTVPNPAQVLNVRAHDAVERRARGGQRTGVSRYIDQELGGGAAVRHLSSIVEAVPLSTTARWGSIYGGDDANTNDMEMVSWRPGGRMVSWGSGGSGTDDVRYRPFDPVTGWGTANSVDTAGTRYGIGWSRNGRWLVSIGPIANEAVHIALFGDGDTLLAEADYTLPDGPFDTGTRRMMQLSTHPAGWVLFCEVLFRIDPDAESLPTQQELNDSFIRPSDTTNPSTILPNHFFFPQWEDRIGLLDEDDDTLSVFEFDPDTGSIGSLVYAAAVGGNVDDSSFPAIADDGWCVVVASSRLRAGRLGRDALLSPFTSILADEGVPATPGVQLTRDGAYVFFKTSSSTSVLDAFSFYAAEFFGSSLGLAFKYELGDHPNITDAKTIAYNDEHDVVAFAAHPGGSGSSTITAVPWVRPQFNTAGRLARVMAVAGGSIYVSDAPPTSLTTVDGSTGVLDPNVPVQSAVLLQQAFFCDGRDAGYVYYSLADNQVRDWRNDVTDGELPTDEADQGCRITCTYRSRIVLSGLESEPQNWFMSAVGDPFNWDYSPETTSATQAVAGNASDAGQLGDVVTALIPFQDDLLFIGGAASIWVLRGDPAAGGQIDNITRQVGIVGPDAWAQDTVGNIYFMGNNGLYRIGVGGTSLNSISGGKLDNTFEQIDFQNTLVSLVYDREWQGVHIFLSPSSEPDEPADHYFWDQRTNSFWRDQYPTSFGPTAVHLHENNLPERRGVLLGGFDGYIRRFDSSAVDDDGTLIESYARFPLMHPALPMGQFQTRELQVTLGAGGAAAYFDMLRGDTPQAAAEADTTVHSKLLQPGRNVPVRKAVRANALAFQIRGNGSGDPWAYEAGSVIVGGVGRIRKGVNGGA